MLTDCRQHRTSKRSGAHKLLIVQGCATVSEERQVGQIVTHSNNNAERRKANVVSHCGGEQTLFIAKNSRMELVQ